MKLMAQSFISNLCRPSFDFHRVVVVAVAHQQPQILCVELDRSHVFGLLPVCHLVPLELLVVQVLSQHKHTKWRQRDTPEANGLEIPADGATSGTDYHHVLSAERFQVLVATHTYT